MRLLFQFSLISCLLFYISCKPKAIDIKSVSDGGENTEIKTDPLPDPFPTVVSFLQWYKSNYSAIQKIELVNWRSENKSEAYSVNETGTEAYLKLFKESGFVSENYILNWRAYFMDRQLAFEKSPQFTGPPEGFEFDFALFTQEIDWALKSIDNARQISQTGLGNEVKVNVDTGMRLGFKLRYNGEKWLIDNIENLGPD